MQIKFIENYDLSKLKPADYNPRKLDESKFIKLQESIKKFGMIKPLIINGENGILTAGHQRTRAMKAIGMTTAPVIQISDIKIQDEIKFNLYHNSIEMNNTKVKIVQEGLKHDSYCIIKPENVHFSENKNATVVKEIGKLILKYGEWGSIVADEDGNVILNSDYAVASKQLGKEIICYIIRNEVKKELCKYLSIEYGDYYYETLGIKSYNQLYCQMNRLDNKKKQNYSSTYERYVIPNINKSMRILDFGAGKCAYVKLLKSKGFNIFAYEPNFQNRANNIDIKSVIKMISEIEKDVERNGLYDVVVLDSVYNSVVNTEVEHYVTAVCCGFLKANGTFITGTRNLNAIKSLTKLDYVASNRRLLEFTDKNNFSATFRNGVWTMQHFHTKDTLYKLLSKYYENVQTLGDGCGSNIYAIAKKPKPLDLSFLATALEFELNMEYPNKYHHNKHLKLKEAVLSENKKKFD